MFDELLESGDPGLDKEIASEMLAELERNTPEEIRRQRAHFRVQVKAKVIVSSGNSSQTRDCPPAWCDRRSV